MNTMLIPCALLGLLAVAAVAETSESTRDKALDVLTEALKSTNKTHDAQTVKTLRQAIDDAIALLPSSVVIVDELKSADKASKDLDAAKASARLRKALEQAKNLLKFRPKMEAALPKGFPMPTPVGAVELKKYPTYRLAKTESRGRNSAFFTLFRHIKSNKIDMTVPVEMTYEATKAKNLQQSAMAFLYQNQKLGKAGEQGDVTVVDVPKMTVVSIGMRGPSTAKNIAAGRQWLQKWLANHKDYEKAGPLRVMAYNSPLVPDERRFFEVQIPVKKTAR